MPDPQVKKNTYPLRRGSEYHIEFKGEELIFPSVTNILGASIPKPQLTAWAARTAATAALNNPSLSVEVAANSIYKSKYSAADIGTAVHGFAESYSKGKMPDISVVDENIRNFVTAVSDFFKDEKVKPAVLDKLPLIEFTVFNITHKFAGTCDFATIDEDGNIYIYDYKTGKGVYQESHLQQLAYLNAEWIYDKYTNRVIPMPTKRGGAYLVHLRSDGGYSKIKVRGKFEDFLHFRKTYDILKGWTQD